MDRHLLPVGREIDQLVAERIFNEPRPNRISPTSVVRACMLRGDPIVSEKGGWQQVLDNGRPVWEPRPWSSDWGLMGLVADKMPFFWLSRMGDHYYQCQSASCGSGVDHICDACGCVWADAETAPLAVCRAALMAVGNE